MHFRKNPQNSAKTTASLLAFAESGLESPSGITIRVLVSVQGTTPQWHWRANRCSSDPEIIRNKKVSGIPTLRRIYSMQLCLMISGRSTNTTRGMALGQHLGPSRNVLFAYSHRSTRLQVQDLCFWETVWNGFWLRMVLWKPAFKNILF